MGVNIDRAALDDSVRRHLPRRRHVQELYSSEKAKGYDVDDYLYAVLDPNKSLKQFRIVEDFKPGSGKTWVFSCDLLGSERLVVISEDGVAPSDLKNTLTKANKNDSYFIRFKTPTETESMIPREANRLDRKAWMKHYDVASLVKVHRFQQAVQTELC